MQQNELLEYIPIGIDNAISNYELALSVDMSTICINRMLKRLVQYQFINSKPSGKHFRAKLYYKNE